MRRSMKALEAEVNRLAEESDTENRPYTRPAEAFAKAGDQVRQLRFFIEEGNAAQNVNRAGGSNSPEGFETAEREARRIVRKLGVGEVFRWSEAYEFVRTTGRGKDGYDYGNDPPPGVFDVVTDYAEVLVVRDVTMDADARAEADAKARARAKNAPGRGE